MKLNYVPLLGVQRELHAIPRGPGRFTRYLHTLGGVGGPNCLDLPPLVFMNPYAKDHVTALLDALLAIDADGVGARAAADVSSLLAGEPGEFKAALVVADDLMGGGTNRSACEFEHRFGPDHLRLVAGTPGQLPRWAKHHWLTGVLWSSEPASVRAAREAVLTVAYRAAYQRRHGPARTLGDMLAQEGHVMVAAGCAGPVFDAGEVEHTREALAPLLGADDMRTAVECLFGDAAGATLGFTPRGLGPWAGLALALHDARAGRA